MEFDKSIYKVVGKIDKELGDKNARIKAVALVSEKERITKLTDYDAKAYFPPHGYIFEPGFFYNYRFNLNEYISCRVEENNKATTGQDRIKLKFGNPEIKIFGINARKINGFKKNGLSTNLNTVSLEDETEGSFYGITDKYIVGKLRFKNGKVEPALHHRIQIWDLDYDNLISIDGEHRIIQEPKGESLILDCMDEKQLFEWFRKLLKQIQPDYVDLLDKNRSWRTELPNLFSISNKEKFEADKIRFKRIEEKFDLLKLSRIDIKTLVDSSEDFKATFEKCIGDHKEEYKENYKLELAQYKLEIDRQKNVLECEIKELQNQKESEEDFLAKLTDLVKKKNDELTKIKENKERIIQDFSIIKEVLEGHNTRSKLVKENSNFFTIEKITLSNSVNIKSIAEFEEQLKFRLSDNSLNPNFAKKIIDVISLHNAILVVNIKVGIAIAEATGNAKYIIQQVEPDWLHFYDFWNNGLGEIWDSANDSPEIFHFLLLEDINMSALECYCRPFLDVLTGVRKRIPYSQTPLPANLKIIATIAPFEEPEVGLPIYRNTFENWGAVGFRGKIDAKSELISNPGNKLLPMSIFINRTIDEYDRENIVNDVNAEFDSIIEGL